MSKQVTLEDSNPAFLPVIRVEIHRNEQDEDFYWTEEKAEMQAIMRELRKDPHGRVKAEYEENAYENGFVLRVFRDVATPEQWLNTGKEQARRELIQPNRIGYRWEDEEGNRWYGHGKVIVK